MQEHRQYIRINRSLVVSYRLINQLIGIGILSKNVSGGGICLPVFQRLEPHAILELDIHLSDSVKLAKIIGEVIWIRERDDVQFPFEIGIKFIKINPSVRDKISDFISKHNHEEIQWID